MKKTMVILASLVLFAGVSFAQDKPATDKKTAKTEKKGTTKKVAKTDKKDASKDKATDKK